MPNLSDRGGYYAGVEGRNEGRSREGLLDKYFAASRAEADLLAAIREDEARQGRPMTPRELEAFAQGLYAVEYRAELRRAASLMASGAGVTDDVESG